VATTDESTIIAKSWWVNLLPKKFNNLS
jgi:hypothetical protein